MTKKRCTNADPDHDVPGECDKPYLMTLPLIVDHLGEADLWLIDAKGDYIAEAIHEDSEGRFLRDFDARRAAFRQIARAANLHAGLLKLVSHALHHGTDGTWAREAREIIAAAEVKP